MLLHIIFWKLVFYFLFHHFFCNRMTFTRKMRNVRQLKENHLRKTWNARQLSKLKTQNSNDFTHVFHSKNAKRLFFSNVQNAKVHFVMKFVREPWNLNWMLKPFIKLDWSSMPWENCQLQFYDDKSSYKTKYLI